MDGIKMPQNTLSDVGQPAWECRRMIPTRSLGLFHYRHLLFALPFRQMTRGLAKVHGKLEGVQNDLARVRVIMQQCRAENEQFFESFTANVQAIRRGIDIVRVCTIYSKYFFAPEAHHHKKWQLISDGREKIFSAVPPGCLSFAASI